MIVAEMIALLRVLPPDATVLVEAPEGGYDEATGPCLMQMLRSRHDSHMMGRHEQAYGEHKPDFEGVVIGR